MSGSLLSMSGWVFTCNLNVFTCNVWVGIRLQCQGIHLQCLGGSSPAMSGSPPLMSGSRPVISVYHPQIKGTYSSVHWILYLIMTFLSSSPLCKYACAKVSRFSVPLLFQPFPDHGRYMLSIWPVQHSNRHPGTHKNAAYQGEYARDKYRNCSGIVTKTILGS